MYEFSLILLSFSPSPIGIYTHARILIQSFIFRRIANLMNIFNLFLHYQSLCMKRSQYTDAHEIFVMSIFSATPLQTPRFVEVYQECKVDYICMTVIIRACANRRHPMVGFKLEIHVNWGCSRSTFPF